MSILEKVFIEEMMENFDPGHSIVGLRSEAPTYSYVAKILHNKLQRCPS